MAVETYLQRKARERAAAAAAARQQAQADSYAPKPTVPRSSNTAGSVQSATPQAGLGTKWTSNIPDWQSKTTNLGASTLPRTPNNDVGVAMADVSRFDRMMSEGKFDTPSGSPTGPSGSRYGGGGGTGASEAARAQAEGLQSLLNSGAFGERDISSELARLVAGIDADQASAADAGSAEAAFINSQRNPYADIELTEAKRLDPAQADLLSRLGGDAGAYRAEIGLQEVLADEGRTADERFMKTLAAAQDERKAASLLAGQQATTFAQSELGAAGTAAQEAVRAQKRRDDKATRDQQMAIVLQLIQANAARGEGTDVSQYFGGK